MNVFISCLAMVESFEGRIHLTSVQVASDVVWIDGVLQVIGNFHQQYGLFMSKLDRCPKSHLKDLIGRCLPIVSLNSLDPHDTSHRLKECAPPIIWAAVAFWRC